MDQELAALTSKAAMTVVGLLATDAWDRAKSGLGDLWRRLRPDRAQVVEAELTEARAELLAARQAGDDHVEQDLVAEWQSRLYRLVSADPQAVAVLRGLVEPDLLPALSGTGQSVAGNLEMRARVSGHGRAYQAGRDLHISDE